MLFIYPAVTICMVVIGLATESRRARAGWCRGGSSRPRRDSCRGRTRTWRRTTPESLDHDDIPATEWPMFGAVFFLVTAEDLQRARQDRRHAGNDSRGRREGRRDRRLAGDGHLGEDQVGRRLSGEGERVLSDAADPGAVVLRKDHGRHAVSRDDVSRSGRRWPTNWPRRSCICATTIPASAIRPTCSGPWRRFSGRHGSTARATTNWPRV